MANWRNPHSTRESAGLRLLMTPVARPNPFVLGWRWRYEILLITGLAATFLLADRMAKAAGLIITAILMAALITLISLWPEGRRWLTARMWCVITPHRLRTGCAQGWIHSRAGKIPVVLLTRPAAFGERVRLWCRAGTSAEDLESATAQLAAACWAREITVTRSERFAQLVTVDVIRRPASRIPPTLAVYPQRPGVRPISPGSNGQVPDPSAAGRNRRRDAA